MKRKLIVVILLILATGYALKLCFDGMNLPSDLTYIGGILGLIVWFGAVIPFVWWLFISRRIKNAKQKDDSSKSSS